MKAAHLFMALCMRAVLVVVTHITFVATIVGCGAAGERVIRVESEAFQLLLEAENAADARRPAHVIAQAGRTPSEHEHLLNEDKLPEPYTLAERSISPAEFHLGYAAERLLREHHAARHRQRPPPESAELVELVDHVGGNTHMVNKVDRDRYIDIADLDEHSIYAVVPPGQTNRAAGRKKAHWHLLLLNNAMLGGTTFTLGAGYKGAVGIRFAAGRPPWRLSWQTVEPGVIAYEWHVLGASDMSMAAQLEAYKADNWHVPSEDEIGRDARALHEVVVRLVQARDALRPTEAIRAMPLLPGTTRADYLQSLKWWSINDDIARLLPIMPEPPPPPPVPVRRDKHLVGQTVGGSGPGPDGWYVTPGRPGNQPRPLHEGTAAHKVIGEHYKVTHPGDLVRTNFFPLSSLAGDANGKSDLLLPEERLLKPDITNITSRQMFEIKPYGPDNLKAGQTAVTRYLTALNRTLPPAEKAFSRGANFQGELGIKFADDLKIWNLTWETTTPGVVQYRLRKLDVNANDEAIAVAIKKAQDEGRWVDLTVKARLDAVYKKAYEEKRWVDVPDEELQRYGELFEQAAELLVANRERIRATQEAVNIPMEITGIAASAVLSAELGRLMTSLGRRPVQKPTPGAVPVTPVPARGPTPLPPVPAPAPGTRVPAPPPPASKPPFRKAA